MGNVVSVTELQALRAVMKAEHKRVIFTNGCYDIIHRGHVEYFNSAKSMGDVLIVGVNSDASVRRIKGSKRPIVNQDDRSYIVANLTPVDYVCIFDEDTPYDLIKAVVPDVLVKGADWKIDDIVGKDIVEGAGGVVKTIQFVPSHSTSKIIDEILKRYG